MNQMTAQINLSSKDILSKHTTMSQTTFFFFFKVVICSVSLCQHS